MSSYPYNSHQKPHPPILATVVAPYSKGVIEMGKKGFLPISANFLLDKWVRTHWTNYIRGCEEAGRAANPEDWRVARSICVHDDHKTALDYGKDNARSPYRYYFNQLFTKLKKANRHAAFKPERDFPDDKLTLDFIVDSLVIAGDPSSVVDQLLAFREVTGDFGTLLYAGKDWEDRSLGIRSMELMAEKVMPEINAAIGRPEAAEQGSRGCRIGLVMLAIAGPVHGFPPLEHVRFRGHFGTEESPVWMRTQLLRCIFWNYSAVSNPSRLIRMDA